MIPDRLPRKASKGEERVFDYLKKLPDDCIIYYEPIIENKYPDFIVIIPQLGLLVIEVKGWYPKHIQAANLDDITVLEQKREIKYKHPLRQARDYKFALMDYCKQHSQVNNLLQTTGEYKNHFIFPFGHFAVLSNIKRDQLQKHSIGQLEQVFPNQYVITHDELLAWETIESQALFNHLQSFFNPFWTFNPLNSQQIDSLRAIIHPEIILKVENSVEDSFLTTEAPIEDNKNLAVLDLKQERNARNIGDGHRVIYGVAGSGKTVLLIARAKLLAQQDPQASILVLCFNVTLAVYLRYQLKDFINITVLHFDAWAKRNGIARDKHREESNIDLGKRLLEVLENGEGDSHYYDSILIDEAQDFEPIWFECVLHALVDSLEGDLIIVGDGNQSLYRNSKISWASLGVKAQGRTISKQFDLDVNYRNSKEIILLASHFSESISQEEEEEMLGMHIDPDKAIRTTGIYPKLVQMQNRQQECDAVIKIIKQLIEKKHIETQEIAILYPRIEKRFAPLFDYLYQSLQQYTDVVWLTHKNYAGLDDPRTNVTKSGLKIQTILSAKGLQYQAVILLWADLLPSGFEDSDEAMEQRLFYVGLTRPKDFLYITCSVNAEYSKFIHIIKKSNAVTLHYTLSEVD